MVIILNLSPISHVLFDKNDFDLPLYPTYEWTKPLCDTTLKVVWQKIISKDSSYGEARFFLIMAITFTT
ncbi:hypothetical protein CLV98_102339 [Dyadobacter jejuensis]|uniref:Uncharacterized protein n=1 Tax=Dyadobacter jejuensis TaxID=1082580 RepID=A0A316ANZ8_9BACT|nr:hypothetical protein CLV98_102339 [Dyadobacter jejuensis]